MSIYALPGELHKLTAASSGPSSDETKSLVKQIVRDKCSSCGLCKGPSSIQSPLVADASSDFLSSNDNNPLQRRPNSSASSSSADATTSRNKWCCGCSVNKACGNNNDVIIAVNSAKLDASRLVKSLTVRKESSSNKDHSSNKQTSTASEKEGSSSSDNSSRRPPLPTSSRKSKNYDDNDDQASVCCDPHESAIQFEISISFNGRKYLATRTLPSILKFRNDLIQEFRARRHWYERRRKRSEKNQSQVESNDIDNDSSSSVASPCSSDDDHSDDTPVIPELPRLSDNDPVGARCGFTMINALLRPYGPALEGWLKTVISMVPQDSQCLTQFLWEPLSVAHGSSSATPVTATGIRSKSQRGNTSSSSLGAILETEDHEQYDSDSDEYLLHHCA